METIEAVKSNPDFVSGLEMPEFNFNLYLIYQQNEKLKYIAFYEGEKLYEGNDFEPSPILMINSLRCIVTCLGFLTAKPGSTPKQIEWAKSFDCGQLACYASEFSGSNSCNRKNMNTFFGMRFCH